jgi:hypothetical protein
MNKFIISILAILFCTSATYAQLFQKKDFYPNVKTVKGKYYNGSGGGGYWSIDKLDSIGRVTEKESYRKKVLLGRESLIYNSNNDKVYQIQTFDINHPNRIDTTVRYEYKYQGNRIVYQKSSFSRLDSTVIQLVENQNDTCLIYQSKSYLFRPETGLTDIYETKHTLTYKNGLLIHSEIFDVNKSSKEITYFKYYSNVKLKRRKIEREPEPEVKGMYVGGPDSDDIYYEYKLDKSGRIKTLYYIIEKKKYKIATYQYYEE